MYTDDYISPLDSILFSAEEAVLEGSAASIRVRAIEKATAEYRKDQARTIAPVEQAYLNYDIGPRKRRKKQGKEMAAMPRRLYGYFRIKTKNCEPRAACPPRGSHPGMKAADFVGGKRTRFADRSGFAHSP